ncbi:Heterokaryon incompatibility protein (HET) domain containing protein [Rhypophila decipiens]
MTLCARCQRFDIQEFGRVRGSVCGYPLQSILQGAHLGCLFCRLLAQQLQNSMSNWAWSKVTAPNFSNKYRAPPWLDMWAVRVHQNTRHEGEERSTIPARPACSLNIKGLLFYPPTRSLFAKESNMPIFSLHLSAEDASPARTTNDITGSIVTGPLELTDLPTVKAWYKDCYDNTDHANCRLTMPKSEKLDPKDAPLPARLVKVDFISSREGLRLTLCETEWLHGTYIALSHRWNAGTAKSQTTEANYLCQKRLCVHQSPKSACSRKLEPFPALYYDAGVIAHHLGIQYIWIDSVCIVQDNDEDWKREAARMARYYQGAWLTLVASAVDKKGGVLGMERNDVDLPTVVQLPYRNRAGDQQGHFYAQAYEPTELGRHYVNSIVRSELRRRGWAFQEWVLSRHILAFSDRCVYMMCQTAEPETTRGNLVRHLAMLKLEGPVPNLFHQWENAIERYSTLCITKFAQDRMIALQGVSNEFKLALLASVPHEESPGRKPITVDFSYGHLFVWGLPDCPSASVRSLLWQEAEPSDSEQRHRKIRAVGVPTWSWASTVRRVKPKELAGMRIHWYEYTLNGGRVDDVCQIWGKSGLPEAVRHLARRNATSLEHFMPDEEYMDHSPLRALQIRGRLCQVRIHWFFLDDEERRAMANLSYHRPQTAPAARTTWRKVSLLDGLYRPPEHSLVGWTSTEKPEYPQWPQALALPPALNIRALFARRLPNMTVGHGWGNITNRQTVFEVLFLRRVTENYYERVGMGRLCGNDVEAAFNNNSEQDIVLI